MSAPRTLLALLALALAQAAVANQPLSKEGLADPFVFAANDGSYVMVGTNARGRNVPMLVSPDLSPGSWTNAGDALPRLPAWAEKGRTWAPEIVRYGNSYLLYFAARNRSEHKPCIGFARSATLRGPYQPEDTPVVCDASGGGAIDASPFIDADGTLYLLWKANGNAVKKPTWIKIARLDEDGDRLASEPTPLIRNDQAWEGIDVEAPSLVRKDGRYVLFYSGAMFNTSRYAVGYAVADTVLGPYQKFAGNPILSSSPRLGYGTGHQAIFRDRCGNDVIVYHAYGSSSLKGGRFVRVAPLRWNEVKPEVEDRDQALTCVTTPPTH